MADEVRSEIEATVRDYVEGWYEGDASRMDRCLRDDLVKRIPLAESDELRAVSKERMVDITGDGGGDAPGSDYDIEVHHVSGRIASAHVRSVEYLDYMHLVETADGWKIANILFRGPGTEPQGANTGAPANGGTLIPVSSSSVSGS